MFKGVRKYFITGLMILLPSIVTYFVLYQLFIFVDDFFGTPIRRLTGYDIPGLGVVLTLILIFIVGLLATNLIGRRILQSLDSFASNIPVVRSIYKTVKQIVDAFSNQSRSAFQKVVMVEYPRKGIYALAFVTGKTKGEVQVKTKEEVINIFLPTTPNPTSGFFLLVPKADVIPLEMSVEDGLKLIISGGVVSPPYGDQDCKKVVDYEQNM